MKRSTTCMADAVPATAAKIFGRSRVAERRSPAGPDPREAAALAATVAIYKSTRVTKKLSPLQAGARKLTRLYGDALVCVRYRQDL